MLSHELNLDVFPHFPPSFSPIVFFLQALYIPGPVNDTLLSSKIIQCYKAILDILPSQNFPSFYIAVPL